MIDTLTILSKILGMIATGYITFTSKGILIIFSLISFMIITFSIMMDWGDGDD